MAQLKTPEDDRYADSGNFGDIFNNTGGGGSYGNFGEAPPAPTATTEGTSEGAAPGGDISNKTTPREGGEKSSTAGLPMQVPGSPQPTTISPPSPEGQFGAIMAPNRPPVPQIQAGSAFNAPSNFDLTSSNGMFGRAGGLLGGGLGVPGKMSDEHPDVSPLIALLATLGQ